jgi:hypothetical protein
VAADSRTRFRGKLYDGREKLYLAATQAPIVFAITGSGDFPEPFPGGIDPESWLLNCTYAFRGKDFVESHLGSHDYFQLGSASLEEIGRALAVAYAGFFSRFPAKAAEFSGGHICRLVLCQVNSSDAEMRFGSIGVLTDEKCITAVTDPRFVAYRQTDAKAFERVGEVGYVDEHVLNGYGRRFLAAEEAIWESKQFVRDVRGHEAALISRAVISAAEQTSATIPLPSGNGIGGPVSCLLVTTNSVVQI